MRADFLDLPISRRGRRLWPSIAGVFILFSCADDSRVVDPCVHGPLPTYEWTSDFEGATRLADLFPANLKGWTNVQCVSADDVQSSTPQDQRVVCGTNLLSLDSTRATSGARSVRMEADPTGASVSKAALVKEGVDFRPGQTLLARMRVFLQENASAQDLFLMDFESTEKAGYPGRRVALGAGQELYLESKNSGGSFGSGPDFRQATASRIPLPRGRWVAIAVELHLSRGADGYAKIWQDGVLVLESSGQTFPAESEITRYDWVEMGLTANSSPHRQTAWLDDAYLGTLAEGATP